MPTVNHPGIEEVETEMRYFSTGEAVSSIRSGIRPPERMGADVFGMVCADVCTVPLGAARITAPQGTGIKLAGHK